jgi:hypothetical protein
VLAIDRDPVHIRLASHNAAVCGRADRVTTAVADVRDLRLDGAGLRAVFIDPARRSGAAASSAAGTARRFPAGQSEPPLDWCAALADRVGAVAVKAAPGLPEDLIPEGWEAEFIAESRDLKEAVLWSPALATAKRRATVLLPAPHTLTAHPGAPVPVRPPAGYLLDPNPAVTRATLVEDLARTLDAGTAGVAKIDPRIAFLTLDRAVRTPFARTLRVLESAPWNEKHFAKQARDLGIGAADIRRRGLAGDVDQIKKRLKLSGPNRATIVITRVSDKPWGLICQDLDLPGKLTAGQRTGCAGSRRCRIPRRNAACPACCMSSSSTEISRTPSVTAGVQRRSTTRSRSASVTADTSFTDCSYVSSWYSSSSPAEAEAVAAPTAATCCDVCPYPWSAIPAGSPNRAAQPRLVHTCGTPNAAAT